MQSTFLHTLLARQWYPNSYTEIEASKVKIEQQFVSKAVGKNGISHTQLNFLEAQIYIGHPTIGRCIHRTTHFTFAEAWSYYSINCPFKSILKQCSCKCKGCFVAFFETILGHNWSHLRMQVNEDSWLQSRYKF